MCKYLEATNFGIINDYNGVSLDGGKTYFDFSTLSESEKKEYVENCLNFFLEDFENVEDALKYANAEKIEEIEDRICYLLK